jgi:hypothetical protein
MPRLLVLPCIAGLSLVVACVDITQPAQVARCAKTGCVDAPGGSRGGSGASGGTTGTGGIGAQGGSAGSGGSTAGTGGGIASGGGASAGTGGASAGTGGGSASTGGGSAGTGGSSAGTGGSSAGTGGGSAGTGGGGSSGSGDAGTDAPVFAPETEAPADTNPPGPDVQHDVPIDTPPVGPEAGGPEPRPEPGPDAPPDIARDLTVDLTPDTTPPRPEAGLDAGNCIQRFQGNGYSLGRDASIAACSACKDTGGGSLESNCKKMIDCLQPLWPCAQDADCWVNCRNSAAGSSVLDSCVATLTSAACGTH